MVRGLQGLRPAPEAGANAPLLLLSFRWAVWAGNRLRALERGVGLGTAAPLGDKVLVDVQLLLGLLLQLPKLLLFTQVDVTEAQVL